MTTQTKPAHTPTFVPPMEYDGKFTISYNLNDGSSSAFRAIPEVSSLIVKAVNYHKELVSLAHRVCFPNGGRDYTDAKEALATLVLKLEGKE